MKKIWILLFYLCIFLNTTNLFASENTSQKYHKIPVKVIAHAHELIIQNTGNKTLNLRNGKLELYADVKISDFKQAGEVLTYKEKDFLHHSHHQGNFYQIYFKDRLKNPLLHPKQQLIIDANYQGLLTLNQPTLYVYERVEIPLQVSVVNEFWVTKFRICNNTNTAIPLKDIEFKFNYSSPAPTNIWGNPWAEWRVASANGSEITLVGGTPWTTPLQPDPNCTSPLTIEFNAAPSVPLPTGPFIFKAEGGVTPAAGSLNIRMPASPANGLLSPNVMVTGPNTNQNRALNWGETWTINNLVAGSYTVRAATVNNNDQYFSAAPVTAQVTANGSVNANITYAPVATHDINVTLNNSPEVQQQLTLSGKNYSFTKLVSNNTVLSLPEDSYTVTAMSPGFSVIITPNPLNVPSATSLTLSYQAIAGTRFVGFIESSKEASATDDAALTNLGNLPSYLNVVNLAFMKPDATYTKGSLNYENTGLQFQYPSWTVLKFAVARLHRLHPNTKVLVSIGGPMYTNWGSLNAKAIADFVVDYGLDGVDINYLPATPDCAVNTGQIRCAVDAEFKQAIDTLRAELPRPFMLTVTAPGVSAYGEGQWRDTLPKTKYTGMVLPLLRTASGQIDMLNVMAYDLGTSFTPAQSLEAYSNYFTGPISMGVQVPPEADGGHVYNLCQVIQLTEAVKASAESRNHTSPAMMLWAITKKPVGIISPENPSAQLIATTICKNLGLSDCNQPILLPNVFKRI